MELIPEEGTHNHADSSTLILLALSIGNVGQLAVDLLVASTKAERVGFLDSPYVLPCVGNDAYGPVPQGHLALPLEAYESSSNGMALIQQRSPVVKGRELICQACGSQMHYLSSSNADGKDDYCEQLGWKRLQDYNPNQRSWKYLNTLADGNAMPEDSLPFEGELEEEEYYYPSLPFSALFSSLKAKGLKVACLLCYCSEGDNTPDAFHLAEAACKLLGVSPSNFHCNTDNWFIPISWKTVYGPPADMSLF
ncbi:putative proteasome assembly chaperone 2 [Rosa chinensis]|uniref:Proteasome assembly chaperone 2 n=1 Tax=Rosa chinensis TaxID=74649 RepID=A0A2P6PN99_ROSCH|nr:putative proteasome assembly chaperone 2 [Rosa chinensis]